MGNNMLKAPLIKSAVLLSIILLLVYLTATSPDGSVWSSLGQIFLAIFRAAQLGIGLVLALGLCFIVLFGIFLGGLSLVSKESAARLFRQLCDFVAAQWHFFVSLIRKEGHSPAGEGFEEFGSSLKEEIAGELDAALKPLRTAQHELETFGRKLEERLVPVEQDTSVQMLANRLDVGEEKAGELAALIGGIGEEVRGLQERVESLNKQAQANRQDAKVPELSGRIEQLEEAVREMVQQIGTLQDTLAGSGAGTGTDKDAEPEHRLFAYIEDPKVRQQLEQLVGETIKQDMTYTGAIDYLVDHADKNTGSILNAHPSLTKDFIRSLREKS